MIFIISYVQSGEFFTKRVRVTHMWTDATLASALKVVALALKGEYLNIPIFSQIKRMMVNSFTKT